VPVMEPELRRLAVAYTLRGEAAAIANALRERFDPHAARVIPAHVTLAGPFNTPLRPDAVLPLLERVAKAAAPFDITVQGVATFAPVSNTTFLSLAPCRELTALHDQLIAALGWTETFPYHPHVTITEYLSTEGTERAYRELLAQDSREADRIDRFTLFEKRRNRGWKPVLELRLGGRAASCHDGQSAGEAATPRSS
jgi:2'-5' RNA ligase